MIRQISRLRSVPKVLNPSRIPTIQRSISYAMARRGMRSDGKFVSYGKDYGLLKRDVKEIGRRTYAISTEGQEIDNIIDSLNENEYNNLSNEYLETLAEELEFLSEDHPEVDAELSHGVLTLVLPPHGTYVINKQPPNKQIWLSSPISGPKRYDSIKNKWITFRDNSSLTELLEEEISSALDINFKFENVQN